MVKICPTAKCDFHTDKDDYTYCGRCGTELISACSACNNPIPAGGLDHCVYCGKSYKARPTMPAPRAVTRQSNIPNRF